MSEPQQDAFDEHADEYDGWFLRNRNVLESEVRLLAHCLRGAGRTVSIGCGSGLFEMLLGRDHGVEVTHGIEPAAGMAAIARERGLEVREGTAESVPWDAASFDAAILNGVASYVADLEAVFRAARRILRPDGLIVVLDVPAESSYGLLYRLAAARGSWDHPDLAGSAPEHPYPLEFVRTAHWRTTAEKMRLLEAVGFQLLETFQTLTRHPRHSNDTVEDPVPGHDRGGYVAIRARVPGGPPP